MKSNFKKLLTFALAAYAATATVQAQALELGKDFGLTAVKIPDFYNDAYVVTGGTSILARENAQREDPFGGSLNVVLGLESVVSGSRGTTMLGKGFSADGNSESFKVAILPSGSSSATSVPTSGGLSIDARTFVHMYFPVSGQTTDYNPFVGTTTTKGVQPEMAIGGFEAKHRRVFADISYTQDLGNFYEGLKFSVSTTLVNVRNSLSASFSGSEPKAVNQSQDSSATGPIAKGAGQDYWNGVGITDFFKGIGKNSDQYNAQAALAHGKFKEGEQSEVGVTDVRASLSLDVLDNDSAKVSVALDGVLPVGRELKCDNLFEPVVGNRHFKLGVKAVADASLADGSDYSANLNVQALWHYAFPRKCNRLPWDKETNYGHYMLGYIGTTTADQTVTLRPIIDIVFEKQAKVNVKPGQSVFLLANASFEKGSLVLDAQYRFSWSAEETNDAYTDITGLCIANWDNSPEVTAASRAKNTSDATWSTTNGGSSYLAAAKLTSRQASQWRHEFAASAAFMFKEWQYPSSVGLRGGYTIAQNRTRNPEEWSLAVKGSFCF